MEKAFATLSLCPEDWDSRNCLEVGIALNLPSEAKPEGIVQFTLVGIGLDVNTQQMYLAQSRCKEGMPIEQEFIVGIPIPKKLVANRCNAYADNVSAVVLPPQTFLQSMSFFPFPNFSAIPPQRKMPLEFRFPPGHGTSSSGRPIVVLRQPPRIRGFHPSERCSVYDSTGVVEAGGVPQMEAWVVPPHPDCYYEEWEASFSQVLVTFSPSAPSRAIGYP